VRAGLLPELARRPIAGLSEPHVAVMRPRDAPLRELALVLARIDPSDAHLSLKAREIEKVLRSAAPHDAELWNGLSAAAAAVAGDRPLIVLIDQFEEVYTLTADAEARRIFLATLLEAASAPGGRVSVILTMRSDFLGTTARNPAINAVLAAQGLIVPAMSEAELREAIEAPARAAGRPLPHAVIERLLDESRDRVGALPLLQFALQQIWNGMMAGEDASEALARVGGVGGALAREAERILQGLDPDGRQIARRAFLAMVSLGEGAQDTRRRAPLSEMAAASETVDDVHDVLTAFAKEGERLVSLSGGEFGIEAEVTHEALFEHWSRLRGWLDEGREDIRFQRQLNDLAEEWDRSGRPKGMLWRPPLLTRLEDYHARNAPDMTRMQLDFLTSSRRDLARGRFLRVGSMAVATLALAAIGLGSYAWTERNRAEMARADAEKAHARAVLERLRAETIQSRFLGNLALSRTLLGDATTGALIALAAMDDRRPVTPEPAGALIAALWNLREAWRPTGLDPAFHIFGFDPSGRYLLLGTSGRDERKRHSFAVDLETKSLLQFPAGWGEAWLAVHPKEPLVAVARIGEPVRLHRIPDWSQVAELPQPAAAEAAAAELQFGPDGKVLYRRGTNGIQRWSIAEQRLLPTWHLSGYSGDIPLRFTAPERAYFGGRFGIEVYDLAVEPPVLLGKEFGRYHYDATLSAASYGGICEGCTLAAVSGLSPPEFMVLGKDGLRRLGGAAGSEIDIPGQGNVRIDFFDSALVARGTNGFARWLALNLRRVSGEFKVEVAAAADLAPDPATVEAANDKNRRNLDLAIDLAQPATPDNRPPLARSADGRFLAVGAFYGQIALWRLPMAGPPLRVARLMLGDANRAVVELAFSPDGSRLVSLDEFGGLIVWRLHPAHHWSIETPDLKASILALSPDGRVAAGGGARGKLVLWNTETRERLGELAGHTDWVHAAQFSADGRTLLTAAEDDRVILWDIATREALRSPISGAWEASMSPDGASILTADEEGALGLWSAAGERRGAYRPGAELRPEPKEVEVIAIGYPAGRAAALLRIDNRDDAYRLVDPGNGTAPVELVNPDERPELQFAATATLSKRAVAIARADGSVAFYRVSATSEGLSATAPVILAAHPNREVRAIAISDDGARMITAANDGIVKLWDLEGLAVIAETSGPGPTARAAAISADGGRIVAAFGDASGQGPQFMAVWAAPTRRVDLIDAARRLVARELSQRQRREFFIESE
jgi:WD40 repeat protein